MMTYRWWCEELKRKRVAMENEWFEVNRNGEEYNKKTEKMLDKGVMAVLSRKE